MTSNPLHPRGLTPDSGTIGSAVRFPEPVGFYANPTVGVRTKPQGTVSCGCYWSRTTSLSRALRQGLEEEGFAVDVAYDGEQGDFKVRSTEYDIIILHVMLPKIDGLTLLKNQLECVRACEPRSDADARNSIDDKVQGLDLGADDYLAKPFQLEELFARLRALIRRGHQVKDPILRVFDLEIDTAARSVKRAGHPIKLTPKEYALLQFLAFHRGKVVTRSMIWGTSVRRQGREHV